MARGDTTRVENVKIVMLKGEKGDPTPPTDEQVLEALAQEGATIIEPWMNDNGAGVMEEWLDAHPEATTTVQDESLTYKKLVKGTLGYVTPEMFGAKGDGVTDDTTAIKNAIAFGKPIFLENTYFITDNIHFKQSVFSFSNGGIKAQQAVFFEGDNIIIDGITFDGTMNAPYTKCVGNHFRIQNCTFKDFSGNASYKFTRSLWFGDDNNDYYDNVVNGCLFDGAYTDYENNVDGDLIGSIRQIYVDRSETVITNCTFKNLEGIEDGDNIHIASPSVTDTNYPYSHNGNRRFTSCPCVVANNVFYCTKSKSAVKVMASDVNVNNNVFILDYVDESYLGARYGIRGYSCDNVSIDNNVIDIKNSSINCVFDFAAIFGLSISNNKVNDYSSNSSTYYNERTVWGIRNIINGNISNNIITLQSIHALAFCEYSIIDIADNLFTFVNDVDETVYIGKWFNRSIDKTNLPSTINCTWKRNNFVFKGTRKSITYETAGIGNITFKNNTFSGSLTDDYFRFILQTDASIVQEYVCADVPYKCYVAHSNLTGATLNKLIISNCRLTDVDVSKFAEVIIKNCEITSTYQAIILSSVTKVAFEGNYVHDIANTLFRIKSGNPTIDISNSKFEGFSLNTLSNNYNNPDFTRKSILWHKTNIGSIAGITHSANDNTELTRDVGDTFFNTTSNTFKMYDVNGNLRAI